jgi:hypothetical protein
MEMNEQDFNDDYDLTLIKTELEGWAEYWGCKSLESDEALQALQRIRNRLDELKGIDLHADIRASSPVKYVEYVAVTIGVMSLIGLVVLFGTLIARCI